MDDGEIESIEHCHNSDYKYEIFYKAGEEEPFKEVIDNYTAVCSIYYYINF